MATRFFVPQPGEVEGGGGQRLLARGKTKRQALVAVLRKLLHAIFGLFKHHPPYDGSQRFPVALAPPEAA